MAGAWRWTKGPGPSMAAVRDCVSPSSSPPPPRAASVAPLIERLAPPGPVIDAEAAARALERLTPSADDGGWLAMLRQAWPALAPVFGASPYLAGLATLDPD